MAVQEVTQARSSSGGCERYGQRSSLREGGFLLSTKLRQLFGALLLAALAACSSAPTALDGTATVTDAIEQSVPADALNPDVRQETIQQTICVPGYAASVRPSTTYTNGVKLKLMRDSGHPSSTAPDYELDHRVPLALGGHPRNLKNLELQAWDGEDGARKKDQLERKLQRLVCAGKMQLRDAQRAMYFQWKATKSRSLVRP